MVGAGRAASADGRCRTGAGLDLDVLDGLVGMDGVLLVRPTVLERCRAKVPRLLVVPPRVVTLAAARRAPWVALSRVLSDMCALSMPALAPVLARRQRLLVRATVLESPAPVLLSSCVRRDRPMAVAVPESLLRVAPARPPCLLVARVPLLRRVAERLAE